MTSFVDQLGKRVNISVAFTAAITVVLSLATASVQDGDFSMADYYVTLLVILVVLYLILIFADKLKLYIDERIKAFILGVSNENNPSQS
jgi:uncharacterized membrane protein